MTDDVTVADNTGRKHVIDGLALNLAATHIEVELAHHLRDKSYLTGRMDGLLTAWSYVTGEGMASARIRLAELAAETKNASPRTLTLATLFIRGV